MVQLDALLFRLHQLLFVMKHNSDAGCIYGAAGCILLQLDALLLQPNANSRAYDSYS